MLHHIIAKLNDPAIDRLALCREVQALFEETLAIPGVHGVTVKPNVIDRPNRYDLMIVIDMDPEALPLYDACDAHKRWKANYGALLSAKAIFDCD